MSKSNDQNYKNLILDYPIQSIQFFAPKESKEVDQSVKITPVRQEQLKDRLGDRFHELDTPLLVEWPDGRRESIVFVNEQESDKYRFSIHRMAIYCLEISKLLKTERVVPVVIFTSAGQYPLSINIGTELHTFLTFNYIACNLNGMNAHDYMNSDNLVARLNLPLMCYNKNLNPKLHYENMRLYVNSSWFLKIYFVKFTSVRKNQTLELTNIKNTNYYH